MFAHQNQLAHTWAIGVDAMVARTGMNQVETMDALERLAQADAADTQLLRLVMCVSCLTLTLALVSSLM